jgi:hypothetical protein
MKLDEFDKAKVLRWLTEQISDDDLCGGRTDGFDVRVGRVGSASLLGTAKTALELDSLEAAVHADEAAYLRSCHEDALAPIHEAGALLLGDAAVSTATPTLASSLSAAILGVPQASLTVLLPWWRYPPTEPVPHPAMARRSRCIPDDGAVLVHPARPCGYVLEPLSDVVRNGTSSVVHLVIAVAKVSPAHQRPAITRVTLV